MEKTYELTVWNTLTGEHEKVAVSEEIYHTYMRTGWNIRDNDARFYAHEIQFSALIGGDDGSFENFREFIDTSGDPDTVFGEQDQILALCAALSKLTASEQELIHALFFEGRTEQSYARSTGVKQQTIHKKKERILRKIKKLATEGC